MMPKKRVLRSIVVGLALVVAACVDAADDGEVLDSGTGMASGATAGLGGTTSVGGSAGGSSAPLPDAAVAGGSGGPPPGQAGGANAGAGDAATSRGDAAIARSDAGAMVAPSSSDAGAAATPSTGCGKAAPASNRYSMDVAGTMREYILAVPTGYDPNRPYRLVFAWHPLGGSAQQVAGGIGGGGYYGLQKQSNGGAILVAPEGLPFQGSSLGWPNTNGRDVAFLRALLERLKGELCIDASRVFSTGFSFGGMMSFTVGCAAGDLMRAVAPMAGNTMFSSCQAGGQPVALMGFHGTNDNVVAIDSGRRGRDAFVQRNKCSSQTMPVQPSWCDGLNQNNQPCSCVSYQGCSAGYPVIWCEFNASHTPAPNSAAVLWSFFSQF